MTTEMTSRLEPCFPKGILIEKFHLSEDAHDFTYTATNNSIARQPKSRPSLDDGATENDRNTAAIRKPATEAVVREVMMTVQQSTECERTTIPMYVLELFGYVRYRFQMKVGPADQQRVEKFEWRPSRGNEVRGLHRHACGGKLVRLGQEGPGGGERKTRQSGETREGKEVVAVWGTTYNLIPQIVWPRKKPFTFQLCGSGKTGELGEDFPVFALMTALRIYTMTARTKFTYNSFMVTNE
ncbi:hypothetical protein F4818DRAFT_455917 [Hypoxylon cercidicola]|nr:hypothetical protein F4818DRAFT_455917 [Hypoxylon cercidicola]